MSAALPTHLEIANGIARLALASPPVNALSPAMLDSLERALASLERRDDWTVLAIASTAKVFCAGGDLQTMAAWMAAPDVKDTIGRYAERVQAVAARIEALPGTTIALCKGSALGGGLELAMACDLRVASSKARFGLPEAGLGLLPGAGGTQRLTRLCGRGAASRMILGAEVVDAQVALQFGLVQWVFAPDEFEAGVEELLARYAAIPLAAVRECKACIALAVVPHEGFRREVAGLAALAALPDTLARVQGFIHKEKK